VTDYTDLQRDIVGAIEAIGRMGSAQAALNEAVAGQHTRLWQDIAELRDDQHALSNRIETLTRALFMEPSEVANVERLRRDVTE